MNARPHNNIIDRILERKGAFLLVFFVVCAMTYALCYVLDFVPEAPQTEEPRVEAIVRTDEASVQSPVSTMPYPERIIIDSLDKEVVVLNPKSRAIDDLDAALVDGVVRHPDSATLADAGNMLLLGHSSYLPTVINKNYQAFNGVQHLVWGDTIRVQSGDAEYVYRVQRVYKTKASETDIPLDHSSAKLTLVTCNTFGSKDDRFVVEADLIDTRPL